MHSSRDGHVGAGNVLLLEAEGDEDVAEAV
jgi:hypothetical protein